MNGRCAGYVVALALGAALAASCGSDARSSATPTATTAQSSATATALPNRTAIVATDTPAIEASATAGVFTNVPLMETGTVAPTATATATPVSTLAPRVLTPIAFSPGKNLADADLVARGVGSSPQGAFRGERVIIRKIGVDAPMTYHAVGPDGVMPPTDGPYDVAFYDFASWPGLGGYPGVGGNVVAVGRYAEGDLGPVILWRLAELVPGDLVRVRLQDGTLVAYAIEFNKVRSLASLDIAALAASTLDESITLITGAPPLTSDRSGYENRQIAWGRRVE